MEAQVNVEEMRKRLRKEQKEITEKIETEVEKVEPKETDNPDSTEMAYDYDYRGRHASWIDELEDQLIEINNALDRIDKGTYGICTNCGRPIQAERLEAVPEAELCIDCERDVGSRQAGKQNPGG